MEPFKDICNSLATCPALWVPHKLTEENLANRMSICNSLLKRHESDPFLKRIVTGDEKWIIYDNIVRKRSWGIAGEPPNVTPKAGLHPKKILLSIWWDHRGVLFYELLPQGKTIDSKVYCTQLTKLNQALRQKRPELVNCKGVIFHYNNARPHRNHSAKISATWLGCFAPLTRPCAIRLPLVPVPAKLPQREIVR